ncbi:MAG: ribulose-phosphate 3-epimerase [Legionellales bacterium RIFCSPHIGHO2_12_FULL_35_11]|nr:MAG: ribulose-phosphate 3-epimerase [Legionellales bacterium RIFCSPHIGHO2_12_FULL_35_11]
MSYKILPSILSANLLNLESEISEVVQAGADMLHLDIMDNHYVPNLTFGPSLCKEISNAFPNFPIDVHLMTSPTDNLIEQFAKANVSSISIHPDATIHLDRSLALIKSFKIKAGIALNPARSPDIIKWCLEKLDFILIMTVNPGFSGQVLIESVISKIDFIHKEYPSLPIVVDGGVCIENIKLLAKVGAQAFVAGSAIFNSKNYFEVIKNMREQLKTL